MVKGTGKPRKAGVVDLKGVENANRIQRRKRN
nr:MAG TPA: hypothetical protein [Caudoviricetes sp.]